MTVRTSGDGKRNVTYLIENTSRRTLVETGSSTFDRKEQKIRFIFGTGNEVWDIFIIEVYLVSKCTFLILVFWRSYIVIFYHWNHFSINYLVIFVPDICSFTYLILSNLKKLPEVFYKNSINFPFSVRPSFLTLYICVCIYTIYIYMCVCIRYTYIYVCVFMVLIYLHVSYIFYISLIYVSYIFLLYFFGMMIFYTSF